MGGCCDFEANARRYQEALEAEAAAGKITRQIMLNYKYLTPTTRVTQKNISMLMTMRPYNDWVDIERAAHSGFAKARKLPLSEIARVEATTVGARNTSMNCELHLVNGDIVKFAMIECFARLLQSRVNGTSVEVPATDSEEKEDDTGAIGGSIEELIGDYRYLTTDTKMFVKSKGIRRVYLRLLESSDTLKIESTDMTVKNREIKLEDIGSFEITSIGAMDGWTMCELKTKDGDKATFTMLNAPCAVFKARIKAATV